MKNLGKLLLSASMVLTLTPIASVHAQVSPTGQLNADKWQEISMSHKKYYQFNVTNDSIVTVSNLNFAKLLDSKENEVENLYTSFLVNSDSATKYVAYHLKSGTYYFSGNGSKDTKKKVYLHINPLSNITTMPNKKNLTIKAPKDVPVLYKYNVAKTYSYIRIKNYSGHKGFTYDKTRLDDGLNVDADLLAKGTNYFFFTSHKKTSYKIKPTIQASKRTLSNKAKKLNKAPWIKMNKVYYGYFPMLESAEADLYRFRVTRRGKITIEPYDMGLSFITPQRAKSFDYDRAAYLGPVGKDINKKTTIKVKPGTYYIVYGSSSWSYNYHFKVTFHK